MQTFNGKQLTGVISETSSHGILKTLLNGAPDRCRLPIIQGQIKRFTAIPQRNRIGQTQMQRSPDPQKQSPCTAQFSTATLEQQPQQRMFRRWIKKRFHHLKVASDLLQTADQQPLAQTNGLLTVA